MIHAKKLAYSPDGQSLLRAYDNGIVAVWDVTNGVQRYARHPGELLGISRNSKTFITFKESVRIAVWDMFSGEQLRIIDISPETYDLHHRTIISVNQETLSFTAIDIFGEYSFPEFQIPYEPSEASFENWGIAPTHKIVAAVIGGSAGGFDWSGGFCFNLISGELMYEFKANDWLYPAPFYFSKNGFLFSGGTSYYHIYDLVSGRHIRKVCFESKSPYMSAEGGQIIDAHPTKKGFIAHDISDDAYGKYYLRIVKIKSSSPPKEVIRLPESGKISDIQFNHKGNHLACLLRNGEIHIWDINNGTILKQFN